MATRFRGPLGYYKQDALLDQAPLALVDKLSIIAGETGTRHQGYANDFVHWEGPTADAAAPGVGGWIVASVDGGGDAAESVDVRDGAQFGILRILTNDADNDNTNLILNGSAFRYVKGKRLWFAIRCAPQTAADQELFFGLAIEGDTDPINTFPTDGFFFEKAETATAMDFHVRQNGTSTEDTAIDTIAMTNDGMREYGFMVDEAGNINYYFQGVKVGSVASTDANIPDDEDLTVYVGVQTGGLAAMYLDVDWLFVAQER